ncbi:MAG: DNA primase, partial [Microlunatus sp.]|nr:DNA primase [Microlunatus sp.]
TPETPLYKKSQVLYGLDLARTEIGRSGQAVVVEGYTDVMAAHLSGVRTAVASCGTAFGNDHARVLQRLMGDQGQGEVVFTFDGDAAGQAAALKVFSLDSAFITQTYVAIEPTGLDPCDLRLQHGEAAVRELIGRRIPLYRFVMTNILSHYDLDRADARVDALREAAPLVASVRDAGKVSGYIRELAGWLGMDPDEVRHEISRAASRSSKRQPEPSPAASPATPAPRKAADVLPDPADRSLLTERETAKLIIQVPQLVGDEFTAVVPEDFTHPAYAAVFRHAQKALANGPADSVDPFKDWPLRVATAEDNPWVNSLVVSLAVEPLHTETPTTMYVVAYTSKLRLLTVSRQIAQIKSRLQRTNPVDDPTTYNKTFSELVVLEAQRKQLQNRSLGLE